MEDPAGLIRQWMDFDESDIAISSVAVSPASLFGGDDVEETIPTIASPPYSLGLLREAHESNMTEDVVMSGGTTNHALRPATQVLGLANPPDKPRR